MTKIGILGDLHANLSALEAVLTLLELEGVDEYYCVGDIVGYGPRPNEVIELIIEYKVRCVAGNHDWALLGKIDSRYFNPYARQAIEWTAKVISKQYTEWLAELPLRIDRENLSVFHGALPHPEEFAYLQSEVVARNTFMDFEGPVGFCGHTHVPLTYLLDAKGQLNVHFQDDWVLLGDTRAIVNVGSVGQPRDEIPAAPGMIYEPELGMLRLLRTPYNIPAERKLIRKAGLPRILGDRLESGI